MKYTSRSNLNDVWIETITVNKYKKLCLYYYYLNILLYTPLTIYLHAQQHAMQGARLQARDSPNDNKQTNKTI